MLKNLKRLAVLLIFGIIVFGSFELGVSIGERQCKVCPPSEIDFSLFWEAYHKLQEKFVDKERLDNNKIIYGAISGMVKSLNDPYTVFFPPEESKKFEEDVKGIFEGVGMEVGIKNEQLQVVSPLEGSPAQGAGLRAGDKVLKINETLSADLSIEEAVNLIRGPKGTEVTLTIMRGGWEAPREIKLVREVIKIPSLKWELKEGNIAYIKIYQFSERGGVEFRRAASEILRTDAQKIVLDLRNNPGGYLEIAQEIAGWFVERGQIVVIEDFGAKQEQQKYLSSGPGRFSKYPMVILINGGSASASEILAGALRDNRGILLIGEKTFGKGSVQELERLSSDSSLKITVAKWLTPKGELINDRGFDPDIKVEMTDEDFEEDKDPQIDKAIEALKEIR